jgi:hypothetical protein
MYPALNYEMMQARHHDMMRSAAQHRRAAEAKGAKARTPRAAAGSTRPARWGMLQRIWHLLPA